MNDYFYEFYVRVSGDPYLITSAVAMAVCLLVNGGYLIFVAIQDIRMDKNHGE